MEIKMQNAEGENKQQNQCNIKNDKINSYD